KLYSVREVDRERWPRVAGSDLAAVEPFRRGGRGLVTEDQPAEVRRGLVDPGLHARHQRWGGLPRHVAAVEAGAGGGIGGRGEVAARLAPALVREERMNPCRVAALRGDSLAVARRSGEGRSLPPVCRDAVQL